MADYTAPPSAETTLGNDWLSLARDAFQASSTYFDTSVRSQVEADIRQSQGLHPTGSKYLAERGRSKLFRPKTRAVIRKNEAAAAEAFFSSNDVLSLTPENDNDQVQLASAAVMSEMVQARLRKHIPWFLLLVGAYQDAQTTGVVASYQYWHFNPAKGIDQPNIRLIPVENLRVDPGADWTDPINTSPYVIELIPMYVADVKRRMRQPDPRTGEARWHLLADTEILAATKEYSDTIRQQREGNRTDSKGQSQAVTAFTVVWVHKNIVSVDDVDYVYYTLGCQRLLSDPVPLETRYAHGRRPYVMGSCVIETHKLYPASVPRLTKDIQAEINEVANQRIDNVKLAMNKRYFARRNKQVDIRSVTKNVPGSVTLMTDTDDVKVVEFNDVTASSYKEQEILNLDFDDVAGSFSGSSVQSNRKLNETVGGMKLLDSNASQVSAYQLRTFVETWVEPVLRQIVLLEQKYETDDNFIALCGEAAQIVQKFGVDTVTDDMLMNEFTLNVNVGMGATNPMDQVNQFIKGMASLRDMLADGSLQKLGLKVDEVIKELFGKLGYKDGSRFFDLNQENPQVAQLQGVVQELQAALAAKHPPALLDAMVRQIDAQIASLGAKDKVQAAQAVKMGTEAQFSAMQTGEVLAAVPAVAPIADELMKAAGYTPPTPGGVDPNFPQIAAPAPELGIEPVKNRRTGIGFMPGDAAASTTLRPLTASPASPGTGVRQGIETVRPDSVDSPIAAQAYANGGLIGEDGYPRWPGMLAPTPVPQARIAPPPRPAPMAVDMEQADLIRTMRKGGDFINAQGEADNVNAYNLAPYGLAPNAINNSPVHDLLNSTMVGRMDKDSVVGGLLRESAFNRGRLADGGLIQGPGTGTSDSVAAQAGGLPLAVSNGEYHIPANVVAALGQDFFDRIVDELHVPTGGGDGAMPTSPAPLPLENGGYIIPADVVQALGQDFFDRLLDLYGGDAP